MADLPFDTFILDLGVFVGEDDLENACSVLRLGVFVREVRLGRGAS